MKTGVVLLSGGLDSCTAAVMARQSGGDLLALTADYGQRHRRELRSAAEIAKALSIEHRVVDVSFFAGLAAHSALTSPDRLEIPDGSGAGASGGPIPATYVPMRNTFFIVLAAACLESLALERIETGRADPAGMDASIHIAANAVDYSGYPDCRSEYFDQARRTLAQGSKLASQYGVEMKIEAPLLKMSKADIVRRAVELKAPIRLTWSCYAGGDRPCGRCDSCVLRAKGFQEAGIPDPVI